MACRKLKKEWYLLAFHPFFICTWCAFSMIQWQIVPSNSTTGIANVWPDFEKRFEVDSNMKHRCSRFEFYEKLTLDTYLQVAESTPATYTLHAVLVHSGDNHGGHYVVFINPKGDGRWCKFDDDVVSRCTKQEAIDYNFGGADEEGNIRLLLLLEMKFTYISYSVFLFDTLWHNGMRVNYRIVEHQAVYQCLHACLHTGFISQVGVARRDGTWHSSRAGCPIVWGAPIGGPQAEGAQRSSPLYDRPAGDGRQLSRYATPSTYFFINFSFILSIRITGHQGFDLYDAEQSVSINLRIRKTATFQELMELIATTTKYGVDQFRVWPMAGRTNNTMRPKALEWETDMAKTVAEVADSCNPWTCFLELLPADSEETALPPFQQDRQVLLFFKYYDPINRQIHYAGHHYALIKRTCPPSKGRTSSPYSARTVRRGRPKVSEFHDTELKLCDV